MIPGLQKRKSVTKWAYRSPFSMRLCQNDEQDVPNPFLRVPGLETFDFDEFLTKIRPKSKIGKFRKIGFRIFRVIPRNPPIISLLPASLKAMGPAPQRNGFGEENKPGQMFLLANSV